jgi:hypothetical protein
MAVDLVGGILDPVVFPVGMNLLL